MAPPDSVTQYPSMASTSAVIFVLLALMGAWSTILTTYARWADGVTVWLVSPGAITVASATGRGVTCSWAAAAAACPAALSASMVRPAGGSSPSLSRVCASSPSTTSSPEKLLLAGWSSVRAIGTT